MSEKGSRSGSKGQSTTTMPKPPHTHGYTPADIPPKPPTPGTGYVPSEIPVKPSGPKPSQGGGGKTK